MCESQPVTISEWQDMFAQLYGKRNEALSRETLCLHIVEEVGEVARDLRKEDYVSLREDLPDVFAWLCAYCELVGINLEDAVWEKYPRVCPYCLQKKNCVCVGGSYAIYEVSRTQNYASKNSKPATLDDWLMMFKTIYGNVNTIVMTPGIGLHLMEEIGELAKQLRRDNHETPRHYEGVADVFAWIMALAMKHVDSKQTFGEMVWKIYPRKCKKCNQDRCMCVTPQYVSR